MDNFILKNRLDILRLGDYCLTDNPQKVIKNIDYDKKNNYWFLDNSSAFNFKTDKQYKRDILSDYSCILEFDIDDIPLRARAILYLLELSKKNNSDQITNITANI